MVIHDYRHSTWEERQEVKVSPCYRVNLMQLGLCETWFKKRREGEDGRKKGKVRKGGRKQFTLQGKIYSYVENGLAEAGSWEGT